MFGYFGIGSCARLFDFNPRRPISLLELRTLLVETRPRPPAGRRDPIRAPRRARSRASRRPWVLVPPRAA